MKLTPHSFATALASSVLPVPLGPVSRTPLGGDVSARSKRSAYCSGHSMICLSVDFASSRPPTSSQRTSGISVKTSRRAEGSTSVSASRKSAIVTSRRASRS